MDGERGHAIVVVENQSVAKCEERFGQHSIAHDEDCSEHLLILGVIVHPVYHVVHCEVAQICAVEDLLLRIPQQIVLDAEGNLEWYEDGDEGQEVG